MTNDNHNRQTARTGFPCPNCQRFIETTAVNLLITRSLFCPSCGLRLDIDVANSRRAFDALRKINEAQRNLEEKSKFGTN